MKSNLIRVAAYAAFSVGLIVFGYLSLQALDWNGVDIPGIKYSESASSINWMLEQVEAGKVNSVEALNFKNKIERVKQRKLYFSLIGFFACAAGLALIFLRTRAKE